MYPIEDAAENGNILLQNKLTTEKTKIIMYYISSTIKLRGITNSGDWHWIYSSHSSSLLCYPSYLYNHVECQMLRAAKKDHSRLSRRGSFVISAIQEQQTQSTTLHHPLILITLFHLQQHGFKPVCLK